MKQNYVSTYRGRYCFTIALTHEAGPVAVLDCIDSCSLSSFSHIEVFKMQKHLQYIYTYSHIYRVAPIVGGVLCLFPFKFFNHLDGEERAGCFTVLVFLVSCDCYLTNSTLCCNYYSKINV